MSRFTFIASDKPLPEVDHTGAILLTVKELKEMNPRPQSFWNLDELPEDAEAIIIPDESALGRLSVSLCTDPPYGLENYIKKDYVYWLQGNFRLTECKDQLLEYLHSNVADHGDVELWSIWFGHGEEADVVYHQFHLSQTEDLPFELLNDTDCCLRITK